MSNYITLFSADPKGEPQHTTRTTYSLGGRVHMTRITNQENNGTEKFDLPKSRFVLADRQHLELFRCDCCTFTSEFFKKLDVDNLTIQDCYGCNIAVQNVKGAVEMINCEDVRLILYGKIFCVVMDGCVNARIRVFQSVINNAGAKKNRTKSKKGGGFSRPSADSTKEKNTSMTIPTILSTNSAQFQVELVDDTEEKSTVWCAKLIVEKEEKTGSNARYRCTNIDINNKTLFAKTAEGLDFEDTPIKESTQPNNAPLPVSLPLSDGTFAPIPNKASLSDGTFAPIPDKASLIYSMYPQMQPAEPETPSANPRTQVSAYDSYTYEAPQK